MIKTYAVMPCETCGKDTTNFGTKCCDNCWEVESRLDQYIQNSTALQLIIRKIRESGMNRADIQRILVELLDSNENRLFKAKKYVLDQYMSDINGWVKMNQADELWAFLNNILDLDQMTLTEIEEHFGLTEKDYL
jgi:hypothetical protein